MICSLLFLCVPSLPSNQLTAFLHLIVIIVITRWVTDRVEVWEEIDQRVYVRSLARALQQQVTRLFPFFRYHFFLFT